MREPGEKQRMVVYRRPRRLIFRKEVLEAYDERCAICDFDLRINDELLGLEAAHIQWHSHKGPDDVFTDRLLGARRRSCGHPKSVSLTVPLDSPANSATSFTTAFRVPTRSSRWAGTVTLCLPISVTRVRVMWLPVVRVNV